MYRPLCQIQSVRSMGISVCDSCSRYRAAGNARLEDGDRYTGSFRGGVPHGQGRMVSSNGDRYQGQWANGRRHGPGRCLFANGDKYQGSFKINMIEGHGVYQHASGQSFILLRLILLTSYRRPLHR